MRQLILTLLFLALPYQVFAQADIGGFAAAVTDETGTLKTVVHGPADPESSQSVTSDTVFHIASLSKQITGAALAMAIRDGQLTLDDPVSRHIPEARHYGDSLTIAHLLYFTSGLTEAYDLPRKSGLPWSTHYYFTVDEAIATSLTVPDLQFQPGSEWRYNNINFQLIAEIVERTYDMPFSDFVAQRIFQPLGMTHSLVNDDITRIIPNRANGIVPRTAENIAQLRAVGLDVSSGGGPILIRRNAPHYGGSGVMTTISDWMIWQREMLTHDTFGDCFWKLMFSTRKFEHPKHNDAFGLVHGHFLTHAIVWFAGGDIDASSYMLAAPEIGMGAACFSNQPGFNCRAEAERLLAEAAKQKSHIQ